MTMAFRLTYHRIMDGGLTHTYTTQYGRNKPKTPIDHHGLLQLQRIREAQQLKTQVVQLKATQKQDEQETWQSLKALPPGPAYRFMSRYEVEEITERVCRPTVASKGIERDSELRSISARRDSSPRFTGCRPVPLATVNNRLFTPTHMTRLRAEKDIGEIIKNINGKISSDSIVVAQQRAEAKGDREDKTADRSKSKS